MFEKPLALVVGGFFNIYMDAPSLSRRAFNGLAVAIIKAEKGQAGTLSLKASATGLAGAILKLEQEK